MRIIFTVHARRRMQERGISRSEIQECIMHPARISMESERVRRFQKAFAYGTIEVVAELKKNHCIVITVYPL